MTVKDFLKHFGMNSFEEAAEHIGIENIRRSRLTKLAREKSSIEAKYKKGSQIYPDFRLMILIRLEA